MASNRACKAAIFNRLKAMMELRICTPICQLLMCIACALSGYSKAANSVSVASGSMIKPSFSTGFLRVASNNKKATSDEISDAVLNRLKLKFSCCWKMLKV